MTNFFSWFFDWVFRIFTQMFVWFRSITIYPNVTLLDFMITLVILEAILGVLISVASSYHVSTKEAKPKSKKGKEE